MIEIKNMSFKYANHTGLSFGKKQKTPNNRNVFSKLNLTIENDRIYGLLGKNGTGKSTLLYLICGLLRPTAGTVTFDGNETKKRLPDTLRDIFIVPEEFDLPPLSLDEFIKLNAPFYPNFDREVLERCLHDFEMPRFARLDELSMGQKKKVYVSFALAAGTRLLLMDEPTNGLDIPSKSQFRRVVTGAMTDGRTIIISTHQVHDVEQLLDHILIASPAGMLLDSPVADILRVPRARATGRRRDIRRAHVAGQRRDGTPPRRLARDIAQPRTAVQRRHGKPLHCRQGMTRRHIYNNVTGREA
jgi:ABC-2 type transport system ATP-binding protein